MDTHKGEGVRMEALADSHTGIIQPNPEISAVVIFGVATALLLGIFAVWMFKGKQV